MASTPGQPKPKRNRDPESYKQYTVPFCTEAELGPMPLEMDGVKGRRLKFCYEYLKDLNPGKAYRRAGFKAVSDDSLRVNSGKLMKDPRVAAVIQKLWKGRAEQEKATPTWVLQKLKVIVHKAMQEVEVRDKQGNGTGEYVFQGAVATNALKLIGQHLGMFPNQSLQQILSVNVNANMALAPEGSVVITKEQLATMPSDLLDRLHSHLASATVATPLLPPPAALPPLVIESEADDVTPPQEG